MRKETSDILNGFDHAIDQIEAMDIPGAEKKRRIKEWLRSRLAKLDAIEQDPIPVPAERGC